MSHRAAWAQAGLASWIVLGLTVVGWAGVTSRLSDNLVTIWHVPAYLGLIAEAIFLGGLLLPRAARRRGARGTDPTAGGSADLSVGSLRRAEVLMPLGGLLFAVLGVLLGLALGSGSSGPILAPPLVLAISGVPLMAAGPVAWAWSRTRGMGTMPSAGTAPAASRLMLLGAVATFATLSGLTFLSSRQHPIATTAANAGIGTHHWEVRVARADGSTTTRVAFSDSADFSQPSWSPDGAMLSAIRWTGGPADASLSELVLFAPDGGPQRVISSMDDGFIGGAVWFPDGRRLLASRFRVTEGGDLTGNTEPLPGPPLPAEARAPRGEWRAFTVGVDGAASQDLPEGTVLAPRISPDGTLVAFHADRDGTWQIYVMNEDGSDVRQLTSLAGVNLMPSWSPDGRSVVFASNDNGPSRLLRVGLNGSPPVVVPTGEGAAWGPSWSPDGRAIAFVSDRDGHPQAYVTDLETGAVRNVTNDAAVDVTEWWLSWSPDSRFLAFPTLARSAVDTGADLVFASVMLQSALLAGAIAVLLLLARRLGRRLVPGVLTLVVAVNWVIVSLVTDPAGLPLALAAALAGGLVGELICRDRYASEPVRVLLAVVAAPSIAIGILLAVRAAQGGVLILAGLQVASAALLAVVGAGIVGIVAAELAPRIAPTPAGGVPRGAAESGPGEG